ncbi:hypothetical protein LINGRAHAP2_LOCUS27574 [Linum grandiflorum]
MVGVLVEYKCRSRVLDWQSNWGFSSVGHSMWKWIVLESSTFWNFDFVDLGGGGFLFGMIFGSERLRYDFPLRFQLRGGALEEWNQFQTFLDCLPILVTLLGLDRVVWPLHTSSLFRFGLA